MIAILVALAVASTTPAADALSPELARVRALAARDGEALWRGYGTAPFGFLLIEPGGETLLCHTPVPAGFTAAGRDAATGCERFTRPRGSFPGDRLAAMPLFGPPSVIVMGTPAATHLTLARWRATILHEHFHQWQAALPAYYARVAALDLSGGDETGMWMLDFAFPYEQEPVVTAEAAASHALAEALAARTSPGFRAALTRYLERRHAFERAAGPRNWRYFEFQLWQEGVARWTEIMLSRQFGDPVLRGEGEAREREILAELRAPDLAGRKRISVYAIGAGEAMLLEACGPGWRTRYPHLLALGPLLEDARRSCRRR